MVGRIAVLALLQQFNKCHSLVGHRHLHLVQGLATQTIPKIGDDHQRHRRPRATLRRDAARGQLGDAQWSPDGSRLAFVANRGDHAFVGVFTNDSTPIVWGDRIFLTAFRDAGGERLLGP